MMDEPLEEIKKARQPGPSLIETFPGIVYQCADDDHSTMHYISKGALDLTGYKPEELIGNSVVSFAELVYPDDVDTVRKQIEKAISQRESYRLEYRIISKDGTIKWIFETGHGIFSTGDELLGLEGVIIEISQQIANQTRIQHYARIVEHIQIGLYVYRLEDLDDDRTLKFVEGNPAAERITAVKNDQLKGKYIDECFPGLRDRGAVELFADVVRTGTARDMQKLQYELEGLAGQLWSFFAFPLPDQCVGVAFEDITARVQLEEQFLQAQKMEVVGRLAGGVAHDFNNLLTGIIGFTELLKEKGETEELDQIENAARRAANLTRQLLLFSRQEPREMKILNLNDTVREAELLINRTLGADINLETQLDPDLNPVLGDSAQINQVLMNLAVNARDAMEGGGQLTIETSNVELSEEYSQTQLKLGPGSYVQLTISDTGTGIDRKTMAKIFDPFFTTKEKGKGTGLGLSTVHGIVTSHDGKIHVYSEPHHGTSFRIYFPRSEEGKEPKKLEIRAQPLPVGQAEILVVEDDPVVRRLIERILEGKGYSVTVAADAAQATEQFSRFDSPPQLIICDVVLPDDTGLNLAAELTRRVSIPILFISGYADRSVQRRNDTAPPSAYLQKPFTPDGLLRKVKEILSAVSE